MNQTVEAYEGGQYVTPDDKFDTLKECMYDIFPLTASGAHNFARSSGWQRSPRSQGSFFSISVLLLIILSLVYAFASDFHTMIWEPKHDLHWNYLKFNIFSQNDEKLSIMKIKRLFLDRALKIIKVS